MSTPVIYDEAFDMPEPCQPIGCDNGYHLPACVFALVDDDDNGDGTQRDADAPAYTRVEAEKQ